MLADRHSGLYAFDRLGKLTAGGFHPNLKRHQPGTLPQPPQFRYMGLNIVFPQRQIPLAEFLSCRERDQFEIRTRQGVVKVLRTFVLTKLIER